MSKYLPRRLEQRLVEAQQQPDLATLRKELGLLDLRLNDLLQRLGPVIFLPEDLHAMLAHQQAEQRRDFPACSRVFHRDGHPIKSIRGSWERACAATGLTGKIPHDFRRTAVRNLVRAGVSEHVAQTMTGHKTRDVFDRYDIVSEGDLREAAVRLNRRISTQTITKPITMGQTEGVGTALSH